MKHLVNLLHIVHRMIKKTFLDDEQIALIDKLNTTPGRVQVVGRGTVIADQNMLINSPKYQKAINDANDLLATHKGKQ